MERAAHHRTFTQRLVRWFWIFLALIFLLEVWLWEHLEPLVAWLVNLVPWGNVKDVLRRLIARLPPWAVLIVFIIPFILLLPLKFLEVYFLAKREWLAAGIVLIIAKLLGLGVTAFIFEVTREKLMQMAWFARMYDWFLWLYELAHNKVYPIRQRIRQRVRQRVRQLLWFAKPERTGKLIRRLLRLRRKVQRA